MLVKSEFEDERDIIKQVLKNHGIDNTVMANSVTQKLFGELEIKRKKKYN